MAYITGVALATGVGLGVAGCKKNVRFATTPVKVEEIAKNFEKYNVYLCRWAGKPVTLVFDFKEDKYKLSFKGEKWHKVGSVDEFEEIVKNMKIEHDIRVDYIGKMLIPDINNNMETAGYGFFTVKPKFKQNPNNPNEVNVEEITQTDIQGKSSGGGGGAGGAGGAGGGAGGGGAGGGGCFAAGTEVLMADGSYKDVSRVELGDMVLGYDFGSKKAVPVQVNTLFEVEREDYYDMQGLKVTGEHPFCVGDNEFRQVRHIFKDYPRRMYGDTDDDHSTLEEIALRGKMTHCTGEYRTFHNFTVDEPAHTYFVKGDGCDVLVHNKAGGD